MTSSITETVPRSEAIIVDIVEASETIAPAAIGVELRSSPYGPVMFSSRNDERALRAQVVIVPEHAGDGLTTRLQEAVVDALSNDGWSEESELSQTAEETGSGSDQWFVIEDDLATRDWKGDQGQWNVGVWDRLEYLYIDLYGPYASPSSEEREARAALFETHPEWISIEEARRLLPE